MDGLSAAASVIAVIQIAGTVSSLCSSYLTAVRNAKHDIESLQEELTRLKAVLEGAQTLLDGPNASMLETSQRFRSTLDDCSTQLRVLETKLKENLQIRNKAKIRDRLALRRLKWPFESKDINNVIKFLHQIRELLSTGLNIDQTKFLLHNFTQVESKERLDILDWISPVPYGKHHDTIKDVRASTTCEWLLQHERFRDWEDSSSSVILWLQGSPGAGKTFLTSKVIDHVQNLLETSLRQEGLAFFYCNRHEMERREPLSVLRSYVRQLSTSTVNPQVMRKKIRKLYQDTRLKGSDLSFDTCREQLLESVNLYHRTTLVLDALDECEPESRGRLVETIEFLLSKAKRPIKVFISSRPDRDIRSTFVCKPNIEIQATHNEKDIRKFVDREIVKHGNWGGMSPSLKKDIVNVLLKGSEGMFQWVNLQMKQILNLESEEAIRDRLGKLPRGLKATYDEMYGKIQARNKYDKALADRAFMWVMCAYQPLSSEELLSAIRLDPDDTTFLAGKFSESQLLYLCNNLLVLDSQQEVWRFSHLSVTEYFEENHWGVQDAHCHAAKICLGLLTEKYKESGTESLDNLSKKDGILNQEQPLQKYCQRYWISHVQTQDVEEVDCVLMELLKTFLGAPEKSSVQYRAWYRRAVSDRIFTDNMEDISPEYSSIFAMCRLSFYTLLSDWWHTEKFSLTQVNSQGDSLLSLAAVAGCRPICEVLIKRGIRINLETGKYGSALAAAALGGNAGVVEFLVQQGADVNMQLQIENYGSALAAAALNRNIEIVEFLVTQGADINARLQSGHFGSALAAAILGGSIDTIRLLVELGADVNTQLQTGEYGSALAVAAAWGNTKTIKLLIEQGAEVNMQLQTGSFGSALAAAALGANTETVELLVKLGADVNMKLQSGSFGNALAAAAIRGNIETVKFLVEQGADINIQLQTGEYSNALAAAELGGNPETVKFLIKQGKDMDTQLQTGKHSSASPAAA